MAQGNLDIKIAVNSKMATKQIDKATQAAQRLKAELDKLQHIKIAITVVEVNRKWWEFWK